MWMHRAKFLKSLLTYLRNARGVTAIEFALVMPLIILLSLGTIEVGLMMFNMSSIEGGLREAARYGITGQQETTGQRQAEILNVLKKYAIGPVDLDDATVIMKTYSSFADVGQPEPYTDTNGNGQYDNGEPYTDMNNNHQWDADRGVDGAGIGDQIVEYKIQYFWTVLTPVMRPFLGANGKLPLTATIVVKNEPCPFGSACTASSGGWTNN